MARFLHRARKVLQVLTAISVVVTGVVIVFIGPAAFAPAVVMALLYCLWLGVAGLENRRRAGEQGLEARRTPEPQKPKDETPEEARPAPDRLARWKTAAAIIAVLLLIALIVAAALFEWQLVGLGALFLFAWLVFSGGGFWLAALKEQEEEKAIS